MTNLELSELVGNPPPGEFRVSMSKEGIFLRIGGEWRGEITSEQAVMLFDAMPLMAQLRRSNAPIAGQSGDEP